MKTWRPNHSGTFSNRVNIHDKEGDKVLSIEYAGDDNPERQKITHIISNVPEIADILRRIAYPERGSKDEISDIYVFARLIQDLFLVDELTIKP